MKAIRVICRLFVWLCMVSIAALMLLMVAEVISRTIFDHSIVGATEWATMLLLMNMTALGPAILSNRQIKVNILTSKFGAKAQVVTDIVILTLAFAAIAVTAWKQTDYTVQTFNNHVAYTNIKLPQWPFVGVFALSYAIAALATLALIVRKVICLFRGGWDREAMLEDTDEIFLFGRKLPPGTRAMPAWGQERDFLKDLEEESKP